MNAIGAERSGVSLGNGEILEQGSEAREDPDGAEERRAQGGSRGRTGGKTMSAWWGTSWNDVRSVVSGRVRCAIIKKYTSPESAR